MDTWLTLLIAVTLGLGLVALGLGGFVLRQDGCSRQHAHAAPTEDGG